MLFLSPRSAQLSNGKHRMHGRMASPGPYPTFPFRATHRGQNRHSLPPWTPCFKRSRCPTPGASGEREVDRPRCPHRSATEAAKHHHHIRQKPLPPPPSSARRQWPRGEAHTTEEAGTNSQAPSFALAAAALPLLRKVRSLARPLPSRPARIPCRVPSS